MTPRAILRQGTARSGRGVLHAPLSASASLACAHAS